MLGGNQSGKTTVCTADDIIQAVDRSCLPPHLLPFKQFEPPFRWRIVAPDFDLIASVIIDKFKELVPKHQLKDGNWDSAYNKQRDTLFFKNGSWCQFKTYKQEPWTHGGATLNRVRFDEEPPQEIFNENRIRIMAKHGDMLCAMTPVQGLTWMYHKFWVPFERGDAPDGFPSALIQTVGMEDNPHLSVDTRKYTLATFSKEEREARASGRFIHFHGRVYGEFDSSCVIPQDSIPANAPIFCGIDPGIRHLAAVVYCALLADDTLVMFHEIGLQGATAKEVAKEIYKYNASIGRVPSWYAIDPSARNKEHITGRSVQLEYSDYGINTFPGQNDVAAGINNVKVRIQKKKLFVMANCQKTIEEFRMYRWQTPQKSAQNDAKEAPIKKDDHLLDALRYVCMARPYFEVQRKVKTRADFDTDAAYAMWKEMNTSYKKKMPAWIY